MRGIKRIIRLDRSYPSRMVVSDLHVDARDDRLCEISRLCDIIDELRPRLLVLNGDIADPWKDEWYRILVTRTWRRLWDTCDRRKAIGLDTFWIAVNHDYNARPEFLPSATLCRALEDRDFIYLHGWEFDWTWGGIFGIPGIAPLAFFLSRNLPWVMVPLYDALFTKRHRTPGQRQPHEGEVRLDWSAHVGLVHLRARAYAKRRRKPVILGHTHYPLPFDGLIANAGDGVWNFSYLCIKNDRHYLKCYSRDDGIVPVTRSARRSLRPSPTLSDR